MLYIFRCVKLGGVKLSFLYLGVVSTFLFLVFEEVLRLLLVGSLSSSEADSDGGVIGLAISLPFLSCDIVKIVSTVVHSGSSGEFSIAGTAGTVTVVGWYGPSKIHFLKASPFGLVSMYLKK
ncbi:hypothetical protein Tco_0027885, partial [Tanacetum coccineum]